VSFAISGTLVWLRICRTQLGVDALATQRPTKSHPWCYLEDDPHGASRLYVEKTWALIHACRRQRACQQHTLPLGRYMGHIAVTLFKTGGRHRILRPVGVRLAGPPNLETMLFVTSRCWLRVMCSTSLSYLG
jgi:hypothetical protein